jgi:DNA topoisomerase-3
MRGSGLGTAATRTGVIKKLLDEGYLVRQGRELRATPKAQSFKKVLERLRLEVLTSPEMTGKWEARLAEIQAGTGDVSAFKADIQSLTKRLVEQTVAAPADLVLQELPDVRLPGTEQHFVELLQDYKTVDGAVRIPKVFRGRHLLPGELKKLLEEGVVGPLDGFYSPRTRKTYPACIRWNAESRRCEVFFDDVRERWEPAEHPQIGVCRHCGGTVHELPSRYACVNTMGDEARCGFQLKKLWCDREITRDEAVQLLEHGRTEVLEGFRGQKGRLFKARIVIGPEGKPKLEFAER